MQKQQGANSWRTMWLIAVYDCPMTSKKARSDYAFFRKCLLRENFMQVQKSLYVKHYPTLATAEAVVFRLRPFIPDNAQVDFFFITDKQYGMTYEYYGRKPTKKKPDLPQQVELF